MIGTTMADDRRVGAALVLAGSIMLMMAACARYDPAPISAGTPPARPVPSSVPARHRTPSAVAPEPVRTRSSSARRTKIPVSRSPTGGAVSHRPSPSARVDSSPTAARYGFSLPAGPANAANQEDRGYEWLRKQKCDTAQSQLEKDWNGMSSPPFVLVFQAAVEVCRDHRTSARRWYDRLKRMFPESYNHCADSWTVRNAYRAVVGYLEDVRASTVPTVDYPITFWPTGPDGDTDYDHDPRQDDFPATQLGPVGS